mgnify:CR=1 FL=1
MPLSFVLVDDLKFVIWGRFVGNSVLADVLVASDFASEAPYYKDL